MTTATTTCTHHYVLPSYGITIKGVCKFCGDVKEHTNYFDADNTPAKEHARKAGAAGLEARMNRKAITLTPRSKPEFVYTRHEAPVREKAPRPPRAERPARERVRAPRVRPNRNRPVLVCSGCGGPASPGKKGPPRCRKCYLIATTPAPTYCACGKEISTRAKQCKACQLAVAPAQAVCLAYIREHDGCTSGEIRKGAGVGGESMTHLLGALMAKGLIERRPLPGRPTWHTYHARDAAAPARPVPAAVAAYADGVAAPRDKEVMGIDVAG